MVLTEIPIDMVVTTMVTMVIIPYELAYQGGWLCNHREGCSTTVSHNPPSLGTHLDPQDGLEPSSAIN